MKCFRNGGYLWGFLLGVLAVIGIVFAVNACVDPQADFLFLTGWNPHPINRIDNYVDVKFKIGVLKSLPVNSIDAAVFGSSRTLRINPECAGFREFGPRTYNLAVQGARLCSIEAMLHQARRNSPGMVGIIALDFFSFGKDDGVPLLYLDSRRALQAKWDAVLRLIDVRTLQESLTKPDPNCRHRLMLNGRNIMNRRPAEIAALPEYLEKFSKKHLSEVQTYTNFEYDPKRISELRKLRERGPVLFFLNPESRWYTNVLQKSSLWPTYLRWKEDLAKFGGVVDFSDATEITDDMNMYFDEHHYLDNAGKLIMEDVANAYFGRSLKHGCLLQDEQ